MLNLNVFLNNGIQNIFGTAKRFYLTNRRGQSFIAGLLSSLQKSAKTREQFEKEGTHIPPFLIASVTSTCNLHCTGCYARANGGCSDDLKGSELTAENWNNIFTQASDVGVSFILLAGGEPLIRRDIIETAGQFSNIIFPIFTNGTMIAESYISLFDTHRNLIPVLSIEGDEEKTDLRRGEGVSANVKNTMRTLKEKGILFGASITVTSENMHAVTQEDFVADLREQGCGLLFYVEYVPAEKGTEYLILDDAGLENLALQINKLRNKKQNKDTIILSFPGDEEKMGGCLAAGRGFFHINASGGAEPCPFSPFSELNMQEHTLLDVLRSPYFEEIRKISAAQAFSHKGGCTLFEHEGEVKAKLNTFAPNN